MSDSKLTTAQQEVLRTQVFDDAHPGPILHDFALVLDYIGEKGVKAAGKYNLLPIEAIRALDPHLAHPLRLQLKRPLLHSHPYLQGLHLLLRATTLGRVAGKGDKTRLVLDPDTLQSWRGLKPIERYFALLEAWLLVSRADMVGGSRRGGSLLDSWSFLIALAPELEEADRTQRLYASVLGFGSGDGLYNAALADLFGLFSLGHLIDGKMYQTLPEVKITPFGEALFAILAGWKRKERGTDEEDEEDPDLPRFDQLRPLLQPWFPEYDQTLSTGAMPTPRQGVFVFKASLGRVWRSIAIADDQTLDDLLGAILRAFDFDSDHLYDFRYRDPFGRAVEAGDPRAESEIPADIVEIGSLPLQPGQSMSLTYDYGDNWQFTVKLERIDPPGSVKKLPKLLESHGEAPEQYPHWE